MSSLIDYFTNVENLLLILPIFIIIVAVAALFLSNIKRPKKKPKEKISGKVMQTPVEVVAIEEKTKTEEKINFRSEFEKTLDIRDPSVGVKTLSVLINKFLSQLFELDHAFTYNEVRKLAKAYSSQEIVELCDKLSKINFGKNVHTNEDFRELGIAFVKVLNSYEYIITEEWDKYQKLTPSQEFKAEKERPFFPQIALAPWESLVFLIKYVKTNEIKKKLIEIYPKIFKPEAKDYKKITEIKDGKAEIIRLVWMAQSELENGDFRAAYSTYLFILQEFNKLPRKKKRQVRNQVGLLYTTIMNKLGLKACYEIIAEVKNAINEEDYNKAKEMSEYVKYIYTRLPPEIRVGVYKKWLELPVEQ